MNIGIDIRPLMSSIRAGVGEYSYELLSAIFAMDKINDYYLFYNSKKDVSANIPKWHQDNIHYVHTSWPNKVFNACVSLFNWPKIDRQQKLDYFFSPNLNFTALTKDLTHTLTVHDLSFELFPKFFTLKRQLWHKIIHPKRQCQLSKTIIVPSHNTKRDLVDIYHLKPQKIQVIYPGLSSIFDNINPIELEKAKEKLRKKYFLPTNFILFLGTIEPRKNIIGLIESFEKASEKLPEEYTLIIAGGNGWKNKKIYNRASNSRLKNRIKFIGYLPSEDKPALYACASLFVYPSFYEGFGFPILEAMAMGTPVITSNRSSLPELADSSATLVNPNKNNEISSAIIQLLTGKNLARLQIKKGLETASKYSWKNTATTWLSLIPQL